MNQIPRRRNLRRRPLNPNHPQNRPQSLRGPLPLLPVNDVMLRRSRTVLRRHQGQDVPAPCC